MDMPQSIDLDYYAANGSASSQYHIAESFTPNAHQTFVCGVPGIASSRISIDSGEIVLSIPHKTRFLSEMEDKIIWAALKGSTKLIAKGRLIK